MTIINYVIKHIIIFSVTLLVMTHVTSFPSRASAIIACSTYGQRNYNLLHHNSTYSSTSIESITVDKTYWEYILTNYLNEPKFQKITNISGRNNLGVAK